MNRRGFIALFGGAAAWPLAARAQQADRVRRIGVLASDPEDAPEMKARLAAFQQGLERLGWSEGRNVRIDYRFAANNPDRFQPLATELVSLRPDVLLAVTTPVAAALRRESRTIPIVFIKRLRSDRFRLHREPGAAGRQSHGFAAVRGRHHRQVAGDA